MAVTKYTYSPSAAANGVVIAASLQKEIAASALVIAVDHIDVSTSSVDIWMKTALSVDEQAVLDAVVAAHQGLSAPTALPVVRMDTDYSGGRPVIRSESRPANTVTYFSTMGDSASNIGDGTRFEWDFSTSDNLISAPTGYKRKRINVTFKDAVYVKEGTLYFHNCIKGSYLDFYIVCPAGGYYLTRAGSPAYASSDVNVEHYLNRHPLQGSVPMGDELNTEAATVNSVPGGYVFRLEITVPESDVTSNGYAELEMYRARTCLLPGESA